ncbi:hypothetical protein E1A91_D05G380000v1 [Gossypium mustelinum]|uniref:Uncharacterized protein n=1 Tax=Gossypium mustelinum TaxID=34275 RepID=A0A5D2V5K3_GOSMU|nr:hypothetical protein E1A91_D05G380000v1 [Gossypium mustelinum]
MYYRHSIEFRLRFVVPKPLFRLGSKLGCYISAIFHWKLYWTSGLTSKFLGLFRLWKALQFYAGFSIFMIYMYQLPIEFSSMLQWIADFVGLFKICSTSEWTEICSFVSLVLFYIMVCTSFITIGLILFKDFS